MHPSASLRVEHLTKHFGGVRALSDVTLQVRPGQVCGLIGPNGAGKTTLLNLGTGIQPATSGSIRMDGQELHGLPAHRIAAHGVARTFQNIRLFPSMTVLETVRVAQTQLVSRNPAGLLFVERSGHARLDARAQAVLDMVGLWDKRAWLAVSLPYGQQRRLELARALALQPKLLLLDEPAAGMNTVERTQLMRDLRRIHAETAVAMLLVEHDMRVIMGLSDYVYVLNFGRNLAHGSPAEVQNDPGVQDAYLGGTDDTDDN